MNPQIAGSAAGVFRIRVEHSTFISARETIQGAVTLSAFAPISQCVLLLGEPGTGKTNLSAALLEQYQPVEIKNVAYMTTRVGACYVEIPSPVTIDGIATVILRGLKDPFPDTGNAEQKTKRIVTLANEAGTQLIILDEFHNLLQLQSPKSVKAVRDWLRLLINNLRATLVIAGTPACHTIVAADHQLNHRFPFRAHLNAIPLIVSERAELQGYLAAFGSQIPQRTGLKTCPLLNSKFDALRVLATTAGVPRLITYLYVFAILNAHSQPGFDGNLTMDHFEAAANNSYFAEQRLIAANPFKISDQALIQQLAGKL